jgi:hypothetical protein
MDLLEIGWVLIGFIWYGVGTILMNKVIVLQVSTVFST